MDWSAAGAPLVATRAVHFAATAIMAGNILFRTVIAEPALYPEATVPAVFRTQAQRVSCFSLAVAVISGVIWLLLQSAAMSGLPLEDALTADVLSTVVNETQFGEVMIIRAGFAILVAACLAFDRGPIVQRLGLTASLAFAASLAWTGHAAATVGAMGYLHLVADAVHLIAAAAWLGGLVPLILLLAAARRDNAKPLARDAVERFSTLGIISVMALMLSGLINTAILVGSFRVLFATSYGQVLLLKLAVFAIMLALATINRLLLTPRLAQPGAGGLRSLTRNSAIELALGLAVIAIVGLLGTLHPAIHFVM
ncbi:copper homeostasis membrane protein CopD [Bradyrhizobium sp. SSUT77]|uniref:copper homeostasis membrane protein CopD n=1 Tax=Bradyrhizobium sp. SSUT77 TaxID=3040603 RepID=UPI00244C0C7A|nr:copper homeostasis membrane protein CopD [Bradyrhizobium sp. SSUT77]MDH2342108.1 copper homeostasis membrane protein CopD [Bradyrhizobium sp. SSUT77]